MKWKKEDSFSAPKSTIAGLDWCCLRQCLMDHIHSLFKLKFESEGIVTALPSLPPYRLPDCLYMQDLFL